MSAMVVILKGTFLISVAGVIFDLSEAKIKTKTKDVNAQQYKDFIMLLYQLEWSTRPVVLFVI